jgi:hypothetical protein
MHVAAVEIAETDFCRKVVTKTERIELDVHAFT